MDFMKECFEELQGDLGLHQEVGQVAVWEEPIKSSNTALGVGYSCTGTHLNLLSSKLLLKMYYVFATKFSIPRKGMWYHTLARIL